MIVAVAWGVAVLIALVVGAFCGYEIRWKLARLHKDVVSLQDVLTELGRVTHPGATRADHAR